MAWMEGKWRSIWVRMREINPVSYVESQQDKVIVCSIKMPILHYKAAISWPDITLGQRQKFIQASGDIGGLWMNSGKFFITNRKAAVFIVQLNIPNFKFAIFLYINFFNGYLNIQGLESTTLTEVHNDYITATASPHRSI